MTRAHPLAAKSEKGKKNSVSLYDVLKQFPQDGGCQNATLVIDKSNIVTAEMHRHGGQQQK